MHISSNKLPLNNNKIKVIDHLQGKYFHNTVLIITQNMIKE